MTSEFGGQKRNEWMGHSGNLWEYTLLMSQDSALLLPGLICLFLHAYFPEEHITD